MSATPRPVVNATAVEVKVEVAAEAGDPPGFRARYRQLGPLVGGELLGGIVYEFDPGERNGPYHYEIGNEECLLVLVGTPTLRHPEGRDLLRAGRLSLLLSAGFPGRDPQRGAPVTKSMVSFR